MTIGPLNDIWIVQMYFAGEVRLCPRNLGVVAFIDSDNRFFENKLATEVLAQHPFMPLPSGMGLDGYYDHRTVAGCTAKTSIRWLKVHRML